MKEVLNAITDFFSDVSFEIERTNLTKILRINLKQYSLEPEHIQSLSKIHPFRIVVPSRGSVGGTTLILFFDFKEDIINDEYCDVPQFSEQLLKDFTKYLDDYAIAEIKEKHIDSFLGYRKIRNAKVQ